MVDAGLFFSASSRTADKVRRGRLRGEAARARCAARAGTATNRRRFVGMGALSLAAAWVGTRDSVIQMITVKPFQLPGAGDLASLGRATAWLDSAPLSAADLQGKVVLVDFWTYTCINWLRTVPYVRAWAARYKEQGLVVIGVHTPEFSFEENVDNVRRSAKERGVAYQSPSTTTARSGMGSEITTGRRSTSSMQQGVCATTTSAKATTEESEMSIRRLLAANGAGVAIDGPSVAVEAHGPRGGRGLGQLEVARNICRRSPSR